jgi:predicted  nucleic acid-binding Zn-ribbon protein
MVEKFKIEKDLLKDTFRKEENKRKEEIAALQSALKKSREDYEELKRNFPKKDGYIKEIERTIEEMKQSVKDKTNEVFDTRERYRVLM